MEGFAMKIFLIKKRYLAALAAVLSVFAITAVVNLPAAVTASVSTRQLPIYCVERDQKVVSISFDAAWGDVKLRHPGLIPGAAVFLSQQ